MDFAQFCLFSYALILLLVFTMFYKLRYCLADDGNVLILDGIGRNNAKCLNRQTILLKTFHTVLHFLPRGPKRHGTRFTTIHQRPYILLQLYIIFRCNKLKYVVFNLLVVTKSFEFFKAYFYLYDFYKKHFLLEPESSLPVKWFRKVILIYHTKCFLRESRSKIFL